MMAKILYTLIDVIALDVQENKMLLHIRCNHEERKIHAAAELSNNNGFTCSFNDYQLAEFIQHKRRNSGKLPVKSAVSKVGPQADKTWVLGPTLYFNEDGKVIDAESCQYVWISYLYDGPGVARQATACEISLPLSTKSLEDL